MRQIITKELFSYWNILRRGRAAPERLEIDPGAIRSLLTDTFILEHESDAGYPFRLSGTRNNVLFDRELRLQPFISLWRPEDQGQIERILEAVSDDTAPVIIGIEAERDRRVLVLEMLLLPLRHHGHTHSRILGCMTPTTTPEWLGLYPIGPLELKSFRVLNSTSLNQMASNPTQNQVDTMPVLDRRALFTSPRMQQTRTLRHLTIYEGGR